MPVFGPSGSSAHLRAIAGALTQRGPVMVAALVDVDVRGRHGSLPEGVRTYSPGRRRWPRRLRRLGERWDARRLDYDVPVRLVWERYSLFCDVGARIAGRQGVPHVLELNAPLAIERGDRSWRAARSERRILRAADRVVAVSSWLADWARGLGCDDVVTVPNGVNVPTLADRDAARRRLGVHGLVLAFIGSLKPWHGLDRLPALMDALPEATLLVAGSGPEPVPTHPRIRALGFCDDPARADLLAAADVGIAPYPTHAPPWFCPLKIVEYRAHGLPVVATDVADCTALVGDNGVIAPPEPGPWSQAVRAAACLPRRPQVRAWSQVVSEALAGLE